MYGKLKFIYIRKKADKAMYEIKEIVKQKEIKIVDLVRQGKILEKYIVLRRNIFLQNYGNIVLGIGDFHMGIIESVNEQILEIASRSEIIYQNPSINDIVPRELEYLIENISSIFKKYFEVKSTNDNN